MQEWTVILRRPDGRFEFDVIEADSFQLEQDPLSAGSRARYYVLRDSERQEVARFNEKDVVGVRKGRRIQLATQYAWRDWDL